MLLDVARIRSRRSRSSRVLGIELLEGRIAPSGTPTLVGLPADVEPSVHLTPCVVETSDCTANEGATCMMTAGMLLSAEPRDLTPTSVPVLEETSAVVSEPQLLQGEAGEKGGPQLLPADPGSSAEAGTPSSQAVGETGASPVAQRLDTLLPPDTVAMDGYGGGYGGGGDLPPTTSGIPDVYVGEDAADVVIQLYDSFDDEEDGPLGLDYSVVGNTNSSLFDSVSIDGYGGLVLDFAPDAFGEATLTVQATDSANQSVEASFTVDVGPVNDAPVISGFQVVRQCGDVWTLRGTVTDVDDPVTGMVVSFGGVFTSYGITATVQADGAFSLTQEFLGLQSGLATAQTQDPHGLHSNEAWYVITV